jgi:RES domain
VSKFPEPPSVADLRSGHPPDVHVLAAGTDFWRVYLQGGAHPALWNGFRFFGPTASRFDHHEPPARPQSRGILYAADYALTCLAEVFQETRVIDRSLRAPWLVGFVLARDVPLLDLRGTWPTVAGASMAIHCGPRPRAQRWSRNIYEAFQPRIEGLLYSSSMHANLPALALYEQAESALPASPFFHRPLSDALLLTVLRNAAHDLNYGLL